MPYSPNVTRVPPLAGPERFGWCCLRCLTRRGISIGSALLGRAGLGGLGCLRGSGRLGGDGGLDRLGGSSSRRLDRRGRSRGTAIARRVAGARRVGPWPFSALVTSAQRGLGGLLLAGHELVALVDPDLDADPPERGPRLVEAVVDVGAQRVQWHAPLAVELRPGHLGAAETARALHPDALGAALQSRLHGLAHRSAERDPARQLLGHALSDELGIDLRRLDLEDVEVDVLAGQLLEVAADAVGLGATAADDDAGPRGVDVDVDPVAGALDLHTADAGALHALGEQPTDRDVFLDVVAVELVGVPAALVPRGDAEAEPVGVDLLSHQRVLPSLLAGATTIVMWLVRLRMR